jgi:alkylated DNA repair dioxygenase AlkB
LSPKKSPSPLNNTGRRIAARTDVVSRRTEALRRQCSARSVATGGFGYRDEIIDAGEERRLVARVEALSFERIQFQGHQGRRRVVLFGWRYDFNDRQLRKTEEIPPFLLPVRQRAAGFAGIAKGTLPHVLVTEYSPGTAIGWHKDKAVFADVIGISLLSACRFRFRRETRPGHWQRLTLTAHSRRSISCRARRAHSGSTASPPSSNCAIQSPSVISCIAAD